jgi:hypothetical protein
VRWEGAHTLLVGIEISAATMEISMKGPEKPNLYTMEFYSATILSFVGKWTELKNTILSKIIQAQKVKSHMFSLICGI